MSIAAFVRGAAVAALLVLVACARPSGSSDDAAVPERMVLGEPAVAAPQAMAEAYRGTVTFTVRWPARQTQAIPSKATKIDFRGTTAADTSKVWNATVNRPGSVWAATATSSFTSVPEGTMSVTATAKDGSDQTVGTATADVYVKPNQRVSAKLTFGGSASSFSLDAFAPPYEFIGNLIKLSYANPDADQDEVQFNGTIATSKFVLSGKMNVAVPSGATSGKIKVISGSKTAESTQSFLVINKVTISPTPANAAKGAKIQFAPFATETGNATFSAPGVLICSCVDPQGTAGDGSHQCDITPGYLYTASTAAGTNKIICGKDPASAQHIITVQ